MQLEGKCRPDRPNYMMCKYFVGEPAWVSKHAIRRTGILKSLIRPHRTAPHALQRTAPKKRPALAAGALLSSPLLPLSLPSLPRQLPRYLATYQLAFFFSFFGPASATSPGMCHPFPVPPRNMPARHLRGEGKEEG